MEDIDEDADKKWAVDWDVAESYQSVVDAVENADAAEVAVDDDKVSVAHAEMVSAVVVAAYVVVEPHEVVALEYCIVDTIYGFAVVAVDN